MKLTKEQVNYIDNYLKQKGIKYWDVRLEMLDHLVSDMEAYQGSVDFNTLFKVSLKKAHWHGNLKFVNDQNMQTTNKIYRAKLGREILTLLKNPIYVIGFGLCFISLRWLAIESMSFFKIVLFAIIGFPILILIRMSLFSWKNKLGRSINLQYGFFYLSFGAIMLNLPFQLLTDYQTTWLPFLFCFYIMMSIAGYRTYKFAYDKVKKLKGLTS